MISGPIPVGSPIEIARVGFMAFFVKRWIRSWWVKEFKERLRGPPLATES
jgi:hypothetical protein